MISKIKGGRASVRATGEPDIFVPCQTLIVAIGQDIEFQHFEEAGLPVNRGKIQTERYGGFDNMPGVFAGGDCASGPASVIKAIAAAKVLASATPSAVMWCFRSQTCATVSRAAVST